MPIPTTALPWCKPMSIRTVCVIAVVLFRSVAVVRTGTAQETREHVGIRAIYGRMPVELTEHGERLADHGVNAICMGSRGLTTERGAFIKKQDAHVFAEFNTMHVASYLNDHPDAAPVGVDGEVCSAPSGWLHPQARDPQVFATGRQIGNHRRARLQVEHPPLRGQFAGAGT